ncbi:hypothetical protein Patl1_35988 [Pistacia atlantica]|nr:hypothetical protein Patl1_35988 [Pistacia atlantica]
MEAKLDLMESEKLLKAKEKVEQKQEPVIKDKLPVEKVEAEIVEDKLPEEKVEFDQEPLEAEVVIDDNVFKLKQEPLKADLEDKLLPIREANGERIYEYFVELNDEDEVVIMMTTTKTVRIMTKKRMRMTRMTEENKKEDKISSFEAVDGYKISTEAESEKEPITDYKQQCLILEEKNKDLNANLAAASESLEHYLQIEKDFLEDKNKWEKEKKDNLKDRNKWETEKKQSLK